MAVDGEETTTNTALKLAGRVLLKKVKSKKLSIQVVESLKACHAVNAPTSAGLSWTSPLRSADVLST